MNPDELLKNMQDLTRKFQQSEGEISEEALQDYLEEVSRSLSDVFELVQLQLDHGMEKIEEARECLLEGNLEDDARMVGGIVDHLSYARRQLKIGQEVANQERDLEPCPTDPEPERLLTAAVEKRLEQLEESFD